MILNNISYNLMGIFDCAIFVFYPVEIQEIHQFWNDIVWSDTRRNENLSSSFKNNP